jgi:hypothetical protein
MGKKMSEQAFLKRHINGQQVYEKKHTQHQ